ncbi:MAG TPA: alpha/beta hydrolase [Acidimicrobiales bacterium]|nr:alpha/beta hydrolase [Acidimicrobiales bacterium]
MKLAYRDFPSTASGVPAIVFHPEGPPSVDRPTHMAQSSGAVGRLVAPFGDYAFYPSGMEVGGICWYRAVPGSTSADPISLTKAVVQATDLVDDLGLDRPALVGWGQGAVVALGAALLRAGQVGSVICVDAIPAHLELLPPSALAGGNPPPVLLAATDPAGVQTVADQQERLGGHGIVASVWHWTAYDGDDERDKAVAERIGQWLTDV